MSAQAIFSTSVWVSVPEQRTGREEKDWKGTILPPTCSEVSCKKPHSSFCLSSPSRCFFLKLSVFLRKTHVGIDQNGKWRVGRAKWAVYSLKHFRYKVRKP